MYKVFTSVEPPVDPPEDYYVTADCGHEVFEGENMYVFDGKTYCPDCLRDIVNDLTTEEIAALLRADYVEVKHG